MSYKYADLAIPNTVDKLFTYLVPPALCDVVKQRARVLVPFGNRTLIGFVIKAHNIRPPNVNLRPILDVLDKEPILSEELFQLTRWMSEYYFAPRGDVLKAVLVQGTAQPGRRYARIVGSNDRPVLREFPADSKEAKILARLLHSGFISLAQLKKAVGAQGFYSALNKLVSAARITIEEKLPKSRIVPKFESVVEFTPEMRSKLRGILNEQDSKLGARQRTLIRALAEWADDISVVSVPELLKKTRVPLSSLQSLERRKLLDITKQEVIRTQIPVDTNFTPGTKEIRLNDHQEQVLRPILERIKANAYGVFLLYGVTGSGKTHVYLEAVRDVLSRGKTAIVLVPEISLTSQIVGRFTEHFGDNVVALHSRMSMGERQDAWRLLRDGRYRIVIGPRSAVFAPLDSIGLIVVDEEQEASYKQYDQSPRYHARDVAVVRARNCGAVVLLGSATPSMESYTNALNGKYELLELPQRVDGAKLPSVAIVDMAAERRKKLTLWRELRKIKSPEIPENPEVLKKAFQFSMISDMLREKIEDRLQKKEGIILLQNRRGFASFIECPQCGRVEMCENCSITLTYHRSRHHLRCHYCGFTKHPPDVCINCGGVDISYRGIGTQRVEEELVKLFPQAKILRMDLDTTSERRSHDRILQQFSDGEVDILFGTQMVAKGLDFSRVTLVGVVSAETQMLLPDFRSSERTFQLLTQVAGRAGRSDLEGEVVIQTYLPQHESLLHVSMHDFKSFYHQELEYRRELLYPPFSQIVAIEIKGKNEDDVVRHSNAFASFLRNRNRSGIILGPAPAVIAKVQGMVRWRIVVKNPKTDDPSGQKLNRVINEALTDYDNSGFGRNKSIRVIIDVDPIGMM